MPIDSAVATEARDARAEFEAFDEVFEQAASAIGGIVPRCFVIAGKRVLIEFAGPALVPYLLPAVSHLEAPFSGAPELVLRAWDSKSTGVHLPPEAGSLLEHQARGMPGTWGRGGILSAFQRPEAGLSIFDSETRRGIFWLPDALKTPYENRSCPFRGILGWFMARNGRHFLHGAAVGDDSGAGVLVVGRGGSGKSTTALLCLLAGLRYVSDDYCLLEPGSEPRVHSLYASAKLHGDHMKRFPELEPKLANPHRIEQEKGVLLLREHFPDQLVASLNPKAVVVPRITGQPNTSVVETARPRAMAALAPSSLLQLASTQEESMRMMAELVRSLPAFELRLGTDLSQIPDAVAGLIRQLGGPDG